MGKVKGKRKNRQPKQVGCRIGVYNVIVLEHKPADPKSKRTKASNIYIHNHQNASDFDSLSLALKSLTKTLGMHIENVKLSKIKDEEGTLEHVCGTIRERIDNGADTKGYIVKFIYKNEDKDPPRLTSSCKSPNHHIVGFGFCKPKDDRTILKFHRDLASRIDKLNKRDKVYSIRVQDTAKDIYISYDKLNQKEVEEVMVELRQKSGIV